MKTIKELEALESELITTGFKGIMRDRINVLKDVLKLIDEILETTEIHEPPTLQELKARIEGK